MTSNKFNAENERIKRRYFAYLEEAKGKATSSVDQIAAAIASFEAFTGFKDFKRFHIEQAKAFKANLSRQTNKATGKPLAIATIHSRLMDVKTFFQWLADKPGYKSRISYSDCDYFNLSANESRVATASRARPYPSLEQLDYTLRNMPAATDFQRRDQAMIATALLTGARDNALASLSIKHFDFAKRQLFQDAREVRTKRRKTMLTDFFPVSPLAETLVKDWIDYLVKDKLFGPNDPAFPPSERGIGPDGLFTNTGFRRTHWTNADAVRKAFANAFEAVGLPYFNPHSVRHALAALEDKFCKSREERKAWSQNLGHEKYATTITSYANVSADRQAEILQNMQAGPMQSPLREPDAETVANVLAYLQRKTL